MPKKANAQELDPFIIENSIRIEKDGDMMLSAFGNRIKRLALMYIGLNGTVKGGMEGIVNPVVEMAKFSGRELNPFSIPPKLSEMKNHDGLVEKDENDNWRLTPLGEKAYDIMMYVAKNWDDFGKD